LKKKPKVSIIIRTRNEEEWLRHTLLSVQKQTYTDYEIVIVDNDSNDLTLKICKFFKIKKIIKLKHYLPGKSINRGVKMASGNIIVLLSAHCVPTNKSWLKNLIKPFDNSNIVAVYGRQSPTSTSNNTDIRDLFITFGLDQKLQSKDPFFHNANSAIRKETLDQIPFDERLTNIEDRDWGKKIIKKGYTSYLETLYLLNKKDEYQKVLNEVINYDTAIITVAALDTFVSNQFGIKPKYPYCYEPISFIHFDNIYKDSSLNENLFIKSIKDDLLKFEFIYDKTGKATKGGEQTNSNLLKNADGNLLILKNIIVEKIRDYRNKIKKENCHFAKKWPKRFTLKAWCVKYDGGKQISHNHPDGWLSGVFYLNVPKNLEKNEGAIKFSIHGLNYKIISHSYSEKIHNPSNGDIVLFPSSLFHETFPYKADDKRIVIAFDLKPYEV